MLNTDNLIVLFFAVPFYHLMFYTIQMITLYKSRKARFYMGLLLFAMNLLLVINALHFFGQLWNQDLLYLLFVPLLLSILPFFYRYVNSFLDNRQRNLLFVRHLMIFLPAILFLIYNVVFFGSPGQYARLLQSLLAGGQHAEAVSAFHIVMLRLVVPLTLVGQPMVLGIRLYRRLHDKHASMQLHPTLVIMAASLLVFIAALLIPFLTLEAITLSSAAAINLFLLIGGGFTGYFGFRHYRRDMAWKKWAEEEKKHPEKTTAADLHNPSATHALHPVSPEEAALIIENIQNLMLQQKPFMDPGFSMDDLCKLVNTKRNNMSFILNKVMGKNFYGLINEYRIREAKRLLVNEGEKYSVEAISQMVGFRHKSSFYTCFREHTGQTPKEYIAENNL